MFDKNLILISGAVVYKDDNGKDKYFLVKEPDGKGWEIPKVVVRKGESSVRAALRMMGEKGAMTTKVLEEAGRAGGVTTTNGKTFPQRYLYYLMVLKSKPVEVVGFGENVWVDSTSAIRKVSSKREKQMLKSAKDTLKEVRKKRKEKRKLRKLGKIK